MLYNKVMLLIIQNSLYVVKYLEAGMKSQTGVIKPKVKIWQQNLFKDTTQDH